MDIERKLYFPEDANASFATLKGGDEYALYFHQLSSVFNRLLACYRTESDAESYEVEVAMDCLTRLLFTVQGLRMKYTYSPSVDRSLWVDLTESGFPNSAEISNIGTDFLSRKTRLQELPPMALLKRAMLDHLLIHREDPTELLWQMSERVYLESLDAEKLFLTFNQGPVVKRSGNTNANARSYVVSWSCYDFKTNRPYIHLMTFDQNADKQPLEEGGMSQHELQEVIRAEGSRAPDVQTLAMRIDDAIESIHPKILKRICIGPLYSRLLLEGREPSVSDPYETVFRNLLLRYARQLDDFILFFTYEIIISSRQQITRTLFAPGGRVREIFHIPVTDPECYERRASVVHHQILLPHFLLQHIDDAMEQSIPELRVGKKMAYNEKGEIYAI